MQYRNNIELSSYEETRCQLSGSKTVIKLRNRCASGLLCGGGAGGRR